MNELATSYPWIGDVPTWAALTSAHVPVWVLNPASGPGGGPHPNYQTRVAEMQLDGTAVLGYVACTWGQKPMEQVRAEIDAYRDWFGVDGIFVDEATTDTMTPSYARAVNGYASKRCPNVRTGTGMVVFNPGSRAGLVHVKGTGRAVWCTWEGPQSAYTGQRFLRQPLRECHLVYACWDVEEAVAAMRRAGVGWGYATRGELPNPWGGFR